MQGIALGFTVAGIVFVLVAIVGIVGYMIDRRAD